MRRGCARLIEQQPYKRTGKTSIPDWQSAEFTRNFEKKSAVNPQREPTEAAIVCRWDTAQKSCKTPLLTFPWLEHRKGPWKPSPWRTCWSWDCHAPVKHSGTSLTPSPWRHQKRTVNVAAAIGWLLIAGVGSLETGSAKYVTWQETADTDWLAACQYNTVGNTVSLYHGYRAWVVLTLLWLVTFRLDM